MRKISRVRSKEIALGYAFLLPWIIGFLIFTLYPVIYSIMLSLNTVQITADEGIVMHWQGFSFYDSAINVDTQFKPALGSTVLLIACATPVIQVLALIIAIILNDKYRFRTMFRVIFFMPVIIMSGPVISRLLTNHTVDFVGEGTAVYEFILTLPAVISKPTLVILKNLVMILWFSGVQILVYLAGLQKISPALYEAADIDGAGGWEKFWKITLPYMKPFLLLCSVYTIVDIASYSENDVNIIISEHIFDFDQIYSFSAAMSWSYFAVILFMLLVVYLLFAVLGGRKTKL